MKIWAKIKNSQKYQRYRNILRVVRIRMSNLPVLGSVDNMKSNEALASSIKTGLRVLSRTMGSTCEMALINLVVVGTKNLCRSTKGESSAILKMK